MKLKLIVPITTLLLTVLWSGVVNATAAVGQMAPDFTAMDSNGSRVTLSSFKGKYVVLEWVHPDCPFTQKHYKSGNMQALQNTLRARQVVWLSINTVAPSNSTYWSASAMNAWLKEMEAVPSALIMDSDTKVGRLYGAKTTPHMFIIDPEGRLIYAGAIDSKRSTAVEDIPTAKNYVSAALDEAMAGKPISTPLTRPYGCAVKYGAADKS